MKINPQRLNIALTGMMGSGKTQTAKALQKLLPDYKLIDTDEIIQQAEGITINEIFAKKGESYFRNAETNILKKIFPDKRIIVSTGGGMFQKEENQALLKSNAFTVYLSATAETLYERLKTDKTRPLLKVENLKEHISLLLKKRVPMYKLAHIEVNTEGKTVNEVAQEILERYKEHGK